MAKVLDTLQRTEDGGYLLYTVPAKGDLANIASLRREVAQYFTIHKVNYFTFTARQIFHNCLKSPCKIFRTAV